MELDSGGAGSLSPAGQRALHDELLRRSLGVFTARAFETVSPGDDFARNWHLDAMLHALTRVGDGECRRLIITVPPRNLKSISASVAFVAWMLGRDPTRRFICVSYSEDLARKHANDTRAVLTSPWYNRAFPHTRIDPGKNTELEVMTTRRGYRLATSVGGTLTGRGGDIIVIDDPIKPQDAMSQPVRERVKHWYANTLLSRLDDKTTGAIVLVMQRVHVDDLAGHLIREGGWEHLNLPAIAEHAQTVATGYTESYERAVGEVLHPAREPLEVLEAMNRAMGSQTFEAQYQQSPVPPGGNMIKLAWFGRYNPPMQVRPDDRIVMSWDTAMKASEMSDYSACTVWLVRDLDCYLLNVVRERLEYPLLKRKVREVYETYSRVCSNRTVLIEDAGSGTSLIQDLRSEGLRAIAVKVEGPKELRMSVQSAKIEAGHVFLPKSAPWLGDFEAEMMAFPHGTHDDQVDATAQALAWVTRRKMTIRQGTF
jgi:predicted phage terminase large subunit-like protein